jgi:cytochrome c556
MLLANPLNESSLAFPILECVHIAGFVCGVGTIALVNFRLLGVGLTQKSSAQLWRDTMPWTLGGILLAIFSGLLLFSINPDTYYLNVAFLMKMCSLVLAVLFYYTAVRSAARVSAAKSPAVACISLALWALVLFGGVFIGFYRPVASPQGLTMPISWLQSLQDTGFFSYIRNSAYAYPVLLALHFVALVFFGGMIVATDLRLLGLAMRNYSVAEIVNGLRVPKRFGLALAAVSGALMFGSKAATYSDNPWFWIKIALLAAIAVTYRIFRGAKLYAVLSLLLWTAVLCAGRGPATIKDIMHSMVDPSGDFLFKSVQQIADEHGVSEKAPKTDAEWEDVRAHLSVLLEVPNALTTQGRMAARPKDRSKNPAVESEPEEIQRLLDADRPNFLRRARKLHDAAAVAMKAVDAKDKDALFQSLNGIDKACESCHLHYWYPNDKRAQEAAREDGITD